MKSSITFEDFKVGRELGSCVQVIDQKMMERWQRLYPDEQALASGEAPPSVALALLMRAYASVVAPRPPGNIHVSQSMSLRGTPRVNEPIQVVVTCLSKEMRKARRFVSISVRGSREGDQVLFDGVMTLIWAI